MFGAICGDIIGSRFEAHNIKSKDFELMHPDCCFTDDTVMTIAVANALHSYRENRSLSQFKEEVSTQMRYLGTKYPNAGYGGRFYHWLHDPSMGPYQSFGNGSAMRVSPVAWVAGSIEEAEMLAQASAEPTHDHPEGIKGAKAIAAAIYLARLQKSKREIREYIEEHYYPLDFSLDEIRESYTFDVTCQGSVPQAIVAFLESESYEDTIRNAISIGGDSDTIAAMAGSIAEAFYRSVPQDIRSWAISKLDETLKACCSIFLTESEEEHPQEEQVMGEFLTNTLHTLAGAAAKRGWLKDSTEIIYVQELWETGQRFVAYWMANPEFTAHYDGNRRAMFYNISTVSLLAGIYYALDYNIDAGSFDADRIFRELFSGNIYDTVAGVVSVDLSDLQNFVNEQYRDLDILIGNYDPDEDTREKLLYQVACAFFQIGCSIELHDLGAGL